MFWGSEPEANDHECEHGSRPEVSSGSSMTPYEKGR